MYIIYDLVFLLYALVYLPYLIITRRAYKGFALRFGRIPLWLQEQIRQKENIWLHAVSVGEIMLLDGFIDLLRTKYPSYQCVVTVTTKTGYALAQERLKGKALVLPSPLDFSFITNRFVSLIRPKIYIAVETEIWPNLYRQLFLNHIPIVVINGRISENSFGRYKVIKFLLKGILNHVKLWCMQSQADAQKIMSLGADPSRVTVTGNIKFDGKFNTASDLPPFFDKKDRRWWVAGSTHPGEEEIILDAYKTIAKDNPQWRLIIAPRHIERVPQIMELVGQKGMKAVKFSENQGEDNVIIVDTIGQLRSLYAIASLVFVGKSLCGRGGQNIIEPAFYGKAIVTGPHLENFRDIAALFKDAGAMVQVSSAEELTQAIKELCADQARRDQLGAQALKVVKSNQGATHRCLEHLAKILK